MNTVWIVYYASKTFAQIIAVVGNENDAKAVVKDMIAHERTNGWDQFPIKYVSVPFGKNIVIPGDNAILLS